MFSFDTSPNKFQNLIFFGKNEYSELSEIYEKRFLKVLFCAGHFIMFSVDERL